MAYTDSPQLSCQSTRSAPLHRHLKIPKERTGKVSLQITVKTLPVGPRRQLFG